MNFTYQPWIVQFNASHQIHHKNTTIMETEERTRWSLESHWTWESTKPFRDLVAFLSTWVLPLNNRLSCWAIYIKWASLGKKEEMTMKKEDLTIKARCRSTSIERKSDFIGLLYSCICRVFKGCRNFVANLYLYFWICLHVWACI